MPRISAQLANSRGDTRMGFSFELLLPRLQELRDLAGAVGLLAWDQETYLPPRADGARGAQLSTMQSLYHERLTAPELGDLLAGAACAENLTPDQRAMVRALSWERGRAVNVPVGLVRALAAAQSRAHATWRAAREARDFRVFQPALQEILELRREQADAIGHSGERYDALLDGYEPGMRVERLRPVLESLGRKLPPMVRVASEACLRRGPRLLQGRRFDAERQWRFTGRLLRDMGFDLEAGRRDRSIHPFTGGTHPRDVRVTIRVDEGNLLPAISGILHEGGHGLYEQGFSEEHFRTPLAAAPSLGLHESQSRLWENVVGRSLPFWRHYFPLLRAELPGALEGISLEQFHAEVNRVEPSPIRFTADELTYTLHILLRFELELLMVGGQLPLDDLPAAWNAGMERLLGVRPVNDLEGVLQDIHWAWGDLGYFPTYALGNLYSAQLWNAARRELPGLEEEIARGNLLLLRGWLLRRVHREGNRHPAEELVRRICGQGLTEDDFIHYLAARYSELYGLALDEARP